MDIFDSINNHQADEAELVHLDMLSKRPISPLAVRSAVPSRAGSRVSRPATGKSRGGGTPGSARPNRSRINLLW